MRLTTVSSMTTLQGRKGAAWRFSTGMEPPLAQLLRSSTAPAGAPPNCRLPHSKGQALPAICQEHGGHQRHGAQNPGHHPKG